LLLAQKITNDSDNTPVTKRQYIHISTHHAHPKCGENLRDNLQHNFEQAAASRIPYVGHPVPSQAKVN
jgi:hypothetical protein